MLSLQHSLSHQITSQNSDEISRLRKLSETWQLPLYAYNLKEVETRFEELSKAFPPDSLLFYSLKANPLPAIVAKLVQCGCGAEVSSCGELEVAIIAGCSPDRILYTGPAKSSQEIAAALEMGVSKFSVESWTDIARLQSVAEAASTQVQCLLRINPSNAPKAGLMMTGIDSQFGFEECDVLAGVSEIKNLGENIEIIGIHVYHGTQINDCSALINCTRNAIQLGEKLSNHLEIPFQVLDVGGGFPWPYSVDAPQPNLTDLRDSLNTLASERTQTLSAQLWFESGRYLSASSGKLLATVMDIKRSKSSKQYVVLDTGIHHLGGMHGLKRIPCPRLSVSVLNRVVNSDELVSADVVGPLCSRLDYLGQNIKVPPLEVGDIVCIHNVGAYGITASLYGFLSRETPIEVAYYDEEIVGVYQLRTGHQTLNHLS